MDAQSPCPRKLLGGTLGMVKIYMFHNICSFFLMLDQREQLLDFRCIVFVELQLAAP